jgi:hypothetical protein
MAWEVGASPELATGRDFRDLLLRLDPYRAMGFAIVRGAIRVNRVFI